MKRKSFSDVLIFFSSVSSFIFLFFMPIIVMSSFVSVSYSNILHSSPNTSFTSVHASVIIVYSNSSPIHPVYTSFRVITNRIPTVIIFSSFESSFIFESNVFYLFFQFPTDKSYFINLLIYPQYSYTFLSPSSKSVDTMKGYVSGNTTENLSTQYLPSSNVFFILSGFAIDTNEIYFIYCLRSTNYY